MKMPTVNTEPISCEEALRRLAEYLDREIADISRAEVQEHLDTCRSCYSRAEFERGLKERLRELREEAVDPAFESRICDLARGFPPA
jgi:anti-sigma factor (TIGR02949 family)